MAPIPAFQKIRGVVLHVKTIILGRQGEVKVDTGEGAVIKKKTDPRFFTGFVVSR